MRKQNTVSRIILELIQLVWFSSREESTVIHLFTLVSFYHSSVSFSESV